MNDRVIKRSAAESATIRTKERAKGLLAKIAPTASSPVEPQPAVTPPPAAEQPKIPEVIQSTPPAPAAEPEAPKAAEPSYVADADDDDPDFNVENPNSEHWKKIKLKNRELKKTAKQVAEEKLAAQKRIEELEAGLVIPEQVQSLTSRISELEPFEKIYNLKKSPAYVEQVTVPMNKAIAELRKLELDYKLPAGVLQRVMDTENVAEQNRLLSQYFDSLGADSVKREIGNLQRIQAKAIEAEKEPAKTLQQLEEDNTRFLEVTRATQKQAVAESSRSAWLETLSELRREGKYSALTYQEGHDRHNEEVVKPVITKASGEYGKLIKALADNGLQTLPKEVAAGLAQMTQLKHQGLVAIAENQALRAELDALKTSVDRNNVVNRPSANGGAMTFPTNSQPTQANRPTASGGANSNSRLKEKARNLLQNV